MRWKSKVTWALPFISENRVGNGDRESYTARYWLWGSRLKLLPKAAAPWETVMWPRETSWPWQVFLAWPNSHMQMSSTHFRLGPHGSALFPAMQKFEKVPEAKVIFDASSPVIVKSKVPSAGSPLVQCLAGEWDEEMPTCRDRANWTIQYGENF